MPLTAEDALETQETREKVDDLSLRITSQNEANAVRGKIDTLLNTFERQRLAKKETIDEYHRAAQEDKSLEGLQGFYKWIADQWQKSMVALNGVHGEINQAVRQGIAGENDREFLMQELILTDRHDFVGEVEKIRNVLREKMERMRRDRQEYDQFKNHKLVQNTGFLKVDKDTKFPVPDEKVFLALTVPQRRELLKKLREALPAAEQYAGKAGKEKTPELDKTYNRLLIEARDQERIIGRKTFDKFQDGFKKIDRKEKEEWIRGFQAEMERYRTLWKQIRGTLKDEPLQHMEHQRNAMGYTQLFTEFGRVKGVESARVVGNYDQKLDQLRAQKIISLHTSNALKKDIRSKDLKEQYRYQQELEGQMTRYRQLRAGIDQLKDKNVREELDELYESPEHGYTQISARYQQLSSQKDQPGGRTFESKMQKLSNIRRDRVRKNVIWSEKLLDTREKKEKMVRRLDQVVRMQETQSYDQSSYAGNVRELRHEREMKRAKPSTDSAAPEKSSLFQRLFGRKQEQRQEQESAESSASNESQSVASQRAQNRQLQQESSEGVQTITQANDAFSMTRVNVGPTEKKVVQFRIGDRQAMEIFLQEDLQLEGRDQIHLMAKEGEVDRMKLEEIRFYRDHLRDQLRVA
ncbi:MAG: hypothetical protein V1908_02355 [Candidatus Peregrinibacteria bacterium]